MKELNNASLPLSFAEGKYSSESVRLPNGQYIIKIIATGPCIGKVLKDNEVLTEVDFSSYKLLSYNDLKISFILSSESDISLEVTPKREDIKVYSASLSSSILPVGVDEYPTPTGTINITENGEVNVTEYATANVNVPTPSLPPILSITVTDSQNNTTVSPVYDGMGVGMPIGQDIVAGGTYKFTVVAVGDVADRLTSLTLDAYIDLNGDPVSKRDFVGATVESFTKEGVKYSSITKTMATYSGSCNTFVIDFGGVKYAVWIAS